MYTCIGLFLFPRLPRSTLFPYTTLFRSLGDLHTDLDLRLVARLRRPRRQDRRRVVLRPLLVRALDRRLVADRKSTRLNSSHMSISYAVFCLKKKNARRILRRAVHVHMHWPFPVPATTEIYTLSLHDALPISRRSAHRPRPSPCRAASPAAPARSSSSSAATTPGTCAGSPARSRSEEHTSELQSHVNLVCRLLLEKKKRAADFTPGCACTHALAFSCSRDYRDLHSFPTRRSSDLSAICTPTSTFALSRGFAGRAGKIVVE